MNLPPKNAIRNTGRARSRTATGWLTLWVCGLGSATVFVAGCHSTSSFPDPDLPDARAASYPTNLLQEGDVVSIGFEAFTNLNAVQKISLDGMLNLESVPPVKAAGHTVMELQSALSSLYQPKTKDDVITVKLVSSANSVYISGAVIRPGKIPIERPMTALEAIMEAGGFDPNRAKLSEVTVLRLDNGKQKTYHLDLQQTLRGDDEKPFYLKPFDIVHVPTKTFNF